MAVPELEQPVVQVALVGGERRVPLAHPPHDREQQVDERDRQHGERDEQRQRPAAATPSASLNACGSALVVAVVAAADSISPTSIEPESPMKIRAGKKLCGRKPRQVPASAAADQRRRRGDLQVARPGRGGS